MTTFDKREEGFERKYAHDQELLFKANARRNKALGLWAAAKLGLSGSEAEDYARSVIAADFIEAGDDDVFRKIRGDFDAKNVDQSDHQIRRTMDELLQKQLADDGVEQQYADLDRAYMEQAVWAPYGNEQFTTFLSERMDFDRSYHHLLFKQDFTSFAIK